MNPRPPPLLSVIVPVYDEPRRPEILRRIRATDVPNEIVVVTTGP
jgi:glycosyltransferase involved in cell wall biosynthesis